MDMNPQLSISSQCKPVPESLMARKGLGMWFSPFCLEKEGMRPAAHLQGRWCYHYFMGEEAELQRGIVIIQSHTARRKWKLVMNLYLLKLRPIVIVPPRDATQG